MVDVMWAIRQFDVGAAAKAIQRPATILYGKHGPTIAGRERFAQAAPNIPIQVMEGSGHFPMLDEPAAFAEIVGGFCARHAVT
jgi:3-oxoadipate enol-lactonase